MKTHTLRHRYGRARSAPVHGPCETRGVLAGAYRASNPKGLLTHTVELAPTGEDLRVLCNRVKLENIGDRYGDDPKAPPTCSICLGRDPRFKGE